MKELTSTKATYRDIEISVSMDRIDGKKMYCCSSGPRNQNGEDRWFETQGEALADERREIDMRLGFTPRPEPIRKRWSR